MDFKKTSEKFDDFLFSVDQIDFPSCPKALKRQFRRQNFEKQARKAAFLGTFGYYLSKKLRFFGAHSPLKINILAPQTPQEQF